MNEMCEICPAKYAKEVILCGGRTSRLCLKHRQEIDSFIVIRPEFLEWVKANIWLKTIMSKVNYDPGRTNIENAVEKEYKASMVVRNLLDGWIKARQLLVEDTTNQIEEKSNES